MRTSLLVVLICGFAAFTACQKQETDEQRRAEIEREVQDRLAAERQAQQQQQLDQREAELNARQKAIADNASAAAAAEKETATPARPFQPVESDSRGDTPESYDLFYTRLEPYGSWLETREYGDVWQPREASSRDWRPYADGHWVYTEAGWTWVSEEPFGWATYHYGRWTRLRNVGWIWVPGDEWAPAWVSWRKGDDYVGWAPLPPEAQFDRRTGIHAWADNYYDIGPTQYCFVPTAQFGTPRAVRTIVPVEQNVTIINRTTNVTNITYNNVTVVNQGPSYDELRSRVQQPIPRLRLERQVRSGAAARPHQPVVRGETIEMVAPVVQRARPARRPREIRRAIAQTEVDHGWADLGNSEAGRQARAKMKSEATAPPNAPSKVVAKTNNGDSATPAPSAASTGPAATPAATVVATPRETAAAAPAATVVATPRETPAATPAATAVATPRETPAATMTPQATSSPSASVTPSPAERHRDGRRLLTPSPAPQASPGETSGSAVVSPPTSEGETDRSRRGRGLKSQARRLNPSRIEPNATGTAGAATASPAATPTTPPQTNESGAGADPAQTIRPRPEGVRRRPMPGRGQRSGAAAESPASSSPLSASPSASPSPSPTP